MRHSAASILLVSASACSPPEPGGICGEPLADQIDAMRMLEHLQALQSVADDNDGTRAVGTDGYEASVAYVQRTLDDAGYAVTLEDFEYDRFVENNPPLLEQTAPSPAAFEHGTDYATAVFSPAGDVTAELTAVDVALGLGNESSSGCEPEDFDAFEAGHIALVQRGDCTFAAKAEHAEAAGATAVLIFNQGDTEARLDVIGGTLGTSSDLGVPVLFLSYAVGEAFAEADEVPTVHVVVDAERLTEHADNVVADTPEGDPTDVVMLGAHLDSVPAGPGINDNGSGTAVLLELARHTIDCTPRRRIRFAWWGAEELGLIGSTEHVARRSDEEMDALAVYLNFDMVASPNFTHFVYDGDGSSFGVEGPPGSATVESLLREHLEQLGIEARDSALNGRSDYWAFMNAGVPVGGTFTGAEGAKTSDEADSFGGEADSAYDGCYHAACDTLDNVALDALENNAGAAAFTVERLATDTSLLAR